MRRSKGKKVYETSIGPISKGKPAIRSVLKTARRSVKSGKTSKSQMRVALFISQILHNSHYEMEQTWDWLTTENNTLMYADIYFPKYNLVIEYHGEQHFIFPNYFHKTHKEFTDAKNRDILKKELISKNNIKFIEWNYREALTEKSAYDKLIKAGFSARELRPPLLTHRPKKAKLITNVFPRRKLS